MFAVADLRESASAIRTELSFGYAPTKRSRSKLDNWSEGPARRLQPKDALMVSPGTVDSTYLVKATWRRSRRLQEGE